MFILLIPTKGLLMSLWFRTRAPLLCTFLLTGMFAGCTNAPAPKESAAAPRKPTIVFMTDFGTANDAVAICKAVIVGIAPDPRIMDITHQVTPFQIEEGSRFLEAVSSYYPGGTVFVAVNDPRVGTPRQSVRGQAKKGHIF